MTSPTNITQYSTVRSWYMRKRIDHWCSVVPETIPTLGSTIQWETRQASFPTGKVDPRVGIFLSPLNTNDGFYLSHIYPYQPVGKIKLEQLNAGRMSIRDVIVMLNDVIMSYLSVFRIFRSLFRVFSN